MKLQKNLSCIKNKGGFTLVEMAVVMSIIAVLFTLMAFGLISAGRQTRLQDAAKTLQSNIRLAANNAISVSPDMEDPTKPAKAWYLEINNGASSYSFKDYNGSGSSSKTINLESGITVEIEEPASTSKVNLVFSSPFARFTAIEGEINGWKEEGEAKEVIPQGTTISDDITIKLKDTSGREYKVIINPATGESSIE